MKARSFKKPLDTTEVSCSCLVIKISFSKLWNEMPEDTLKVTAVLQEDLKTKLCWVCVIGLGPNREEKTVQIYP